jgi:hypothetical protein
MNFLLLRSKDKRMKKWGILGALLLVAGVLAYRPDTVRGANSSHAPIVITTDSDFQICNRVVSGSGTTTDPYMASITSYQARIVNYRRIESEQREEKCLAGFCHNLPLFSGLRRLR